MPFPPPCLLLVQHERTCFQLLFRLRAPLDNLATLQEFVVIQVAVKDVCLRKEQQSFTNLVSTADLPLCVVAADAELHHGASHLQPQVWDVLINGQAGGTIHQLDAYECAALGLEQVVDQVLTVEVDDASPIWVVLAQRALWVQTAQRPAAQHRR